MQCMNNMVVYVRGGEDNPSKELSIYDDYQEKDCSKMVFKSEIKSIKLTDVW